MRAAARRLTRRLGRRGALLTLKGTIATLYGYGQIVAPAHDRRGLTLLLKGMPLKAWATAWIVAGVVALVCAWLPPRRDWPGFFAVWGITAPWAMSYLAAWWPLGLYERGWVPAIIFGAFGSVCLVAAGWPEPPARSEASGET
ncbi:hypothetical protein ACFOOM_07525 [Streptomyces echinoruber]|uniref:Uncharacterized protein n=1 Tax=Streptomyces echinoruber TaxID=68898 RepID=A0A918V816_9ACTN|nr:hypothetical protein [Streptomyces echinoruber]GGZ80211.1 hypothetical protein GCM10010389_17430 [Streptomyces echinoruber]